MDIPTADEMVELMDKLDNHFNTQLMKAIFTLRANKAWKKAGSGKAGLASGNQLI